MSHSTPNDPGCPYVVRSDRALRFLGKTDGDVVDGFAAVAGALAGDDRLTAADVFALLHDAAFARAMERVATTGGPVDPADPRTTWPATVEILRMLARIAPGLLEELDILDGRNLSGQRVAEVLSSWRVERRAGLPAVAEWRRSLRSMFLAPRCAPLTAEALRRAQNRPIPRPDGRVVYRRLRLEDPATGEPARTEDILAAAEKAVRDADSDPAYKSKMTLRVGRDGRFHANENLLVDRVARILQWWGLERSARVAPADEDGDGPPSGVARHVEPVDDAEDPAEALERIEVLRNLREMLAGLGAAQRAALLLVADRLLPHDEERPALTLGSAAEAEGVSLEAVRYRVPWAEGELGRLRARIGRPRATG